jgi:hypothetical protein
MKLPKEFLIWKEWGRGERDREKERKRDRQIQREGERADNKNHGQRRVALLSHK